MVLNQLRRLFDSEYLGRFGSWVPEKPYGYAPADWRVMGFNGKDLVGHVGIQARVIGVGDRDVTVGGVGGVLVAAEQRHRGLGCLLLIREAYQLLQINPATGEIRS